MNTLAQYHAANLPDLMDRITKNSIGMDDYLNAFFNFDNATAIQNYPPYNLININNVANGTNSAAATAIRALNSVLYNNAAGTG